MNLFATIFKICECFEFEESALGVLDWAGAGKPSWAQSSVLASIAELEPHNSLRPDNLDKLLMRTNGYRKLLV